MMYAVTVSVATLYVLFIVACWRIATYFCVGKQWLLLLPVINLVYYAYMSDVVAVEAHDSKSSHCRWGMCALLGLIGVSVVLRGMYQYEILALAGDIILILGVIFTFLVFSWCYMIILVNSFDFPGMVCLASLIIPFPVWLFIASFTIKGKTEEVVELYWD